MAIDDTLTNNSDENRTVTNSDEPPTVHSDRRHFPTKLTELECWVVWADVKIPRAPWATEHLFPAKWGEDADPRPETDFQTALSWANKSLEHLTFRYADRYPIDDDTGERDVRELDLGLCMYHADIPEHSIVLLDFDKVRNPETGDVLPVVLELMEMAGSFAEISQSGKGIHVYVIGHLPDVLENLVEAPLGESLEYFDDEAHVEVYDPIKFCAMTGDAVEGFPDTIEKSQKVIDHLVREYVPEKKLEETSRIEAPEMSDRQKRAIEERADNSRRRAKTDYYDMPVEHVTPLTVNRSDSEGESGPHPAHGPAQSDWDECTNFTIPNGKNVWFCRWHKTGGGPLHLVYCLESSNPKAACDECTSGLFDRLSDEEFLDLCLAAKNKYGFSDNPPKRALNALCERAGVNIPSDELKQAFFANQ